MVTLMILIIDMHMVAHFCINQSSFSSGNIFSVSLHGLVLRKVSVHPSVCQTCALWQNGRKICPDFYTNTKDHLS